MIGCHFVRRTVMYRSTGSRNVTLDYFQFKILEPEGQELNDVLSSFSRADLGCPSSKLNLP